jgi:hypothetical protein
MPVTVEASTTAASWRVLFARLLVARIVTTDLTQLTLAELYQLYGRFNWFAEGDFEGLVLEPNEWVTVKQLYEANDQVHSEIHRRRSTFIGAYAYRMRGRRYRPWLEDMPTMAAVHLRVARPAPRARTGRARRLVVRVARRTRRATAPGRPADDPDLAPPAGAVAA